MTQYDDDYNYEGMDEYEEQYPYNYHSDLNWDDDEEDQFNPDEED